MTNPALATLTQWLMEEDYDLLLIPTEDRFLSEYPPEHARRLGWLTGFAGSAGMAVITKDGQHHLFTDGRYQTQARLQLPASFTIHHTATTPFSKWLENLATPAQIAYDPWLHSTQTIKIWQKIAMKHGHMLAVLKEQPIDRLWSERPIPSPSRPYLHPLTYAGWSAPEKLAKVQQALRDAGVEHYLLADTTSLCWLLNIRASDVPCTPLMLGYALISADHGVEVWADIDPENQAIFEQLGVPCALHPLQSLKLPTDKIGMTAAQTPAALAQLAASFVEMPNPCLLLKARKHPIEQEGAREAHQQDGVAVCNALASISSTHDEIDVAALLYHSRLAQKDFVEPSFPTIAGFREHGAIIHYHAEAATAHNLVGDGLLLIDSGGQYYSGTTDITRTITLGESTETQRLHYTLVLKGHVQLAMAVFPEGTTGAHLDALARMPLWQEGLDYGHGTGHGVGSFLSVHEGPQGISQRSNGMPLQAGMILSNEPGYYREGHYGIRIENLMLVVPHINPGFLSFETLTLVPYCRSLMTISLLTPAEKYWINAYHARIVSKLKPHLHDENVRDWLRYHTQPLE
jgi:Xaa-Pro aminopeptidase